jgi:hypothetical protein
VAGASELADRGPQPAAERGLAAERLATGELIAELVGGGDAEIAELNNGGAAGLHRAVTGCAQQPDRLDDPVGLLRDRLGLAGQEQSGRHLRIDGIALAPPTASVRVRLIDLDDPHGMLTQIADQGGGIRTGRLDPSPKARSQSNSCA